MIRQGNRLRVWAVECVLTGSSPSERALVLERIVELTRLLLDLGNLSSAMSLHSALGHAAISRLKASLGCMSKSYVKVRGTVCVSDA